MHRPSRANAPFLFFQLAWSYGVLRFLLRLGGYFRSYHNSGCFQKPLGSLQVILVDPIFTYLNLLQFLLDLLTSYVTLTLTPPSNYLIIHDL